jgi:tRNA pseudouridine55 synthase
MIMTSGILIVDKPAGLTSFGVVKKVRGALRVKKAGHTGTLDPMATGVLPVCLGEATKIAGLLTAADKAYDGEGLLGIETDTLDVTGQETARHEVPGDLTRESLERVLADLRGKQQQVPPAYSAVRQGGERSYKRARRGEAVQLEAREVQIHALELVRFELPRFAFSVQCSKGTYVRSLVAEIGARLGCGATLAALRRTRAGYFDLARAVPLDQVRLRQDAGDLPLISVDAALALEGLLAVELSAEQADGIRHGQPAAPQEGDTPAGLLRLRCGDDLVALGELRDGQLWPKRVFAAPHG